ncbi:hypothetical protein ES703_58187 [subsurface metagenome]
MPELRFYLLWQPFGLFGKIIIFKKENAEKEHGELYTIGQKML